MSSCCCCCCFLFAIGFLPLVILVGGVLYWLLTMGLYSNLLNISLTAGTATIIGGIIIGGIIIGGILSLIFLQRSQFLLRLSTSPNPCQDIWNLSVRPTSFQDILESFRPPKYLFRIFFGIFPSAHKIFSGYFWNLSVRPQIFSGYFRTIPNIFSWIILGQFPENNFSRFLPNMGPLSNSAKTTYIYLSFLVGTNLVLMLSSDPMTVFVGFVCLIMSFSSLASFHLDQVMRDQEHI